MPRISFGFDTELDFSTALSNPGGQDSSQTGPLTLSFELAVGQGPTQFTIKPSPGFRFSIDKVLSVLANALKIDALNKVVDLTSEKPWSLIFKTEISPEISVLVSNTESVAQCILTLYEQGKTQPGVKIGGKYDGPIPITIEPNFTVFSLIINYNKSKGGLGVSAKVQFDDQPKPSSATWIKTSSPDGPDDQSKTQVVKFPFPVPDQGGSGFKLNYLGLGQRFGPPLPKDTNQFATALEDIFDELEKNLTTNDPQALLETLVKDYYHPDRDWFAALDAELKGWRVRLLFNDPVLYGVEVSCSVDAFKGLDLIILYEKLGPHLGVYYGKLTIPEQYRQINLGAVALTLPTVQIWIYTNGDFKVNVGWPLGSDSIGIQVYIFTGGCGFYFGKLRSGDNPQTQNAPVQYNPIFVFGLGLWLGVGRSFSKGPLSANLSLTVQGTFQGILAWQDGNNTSNPPDYYWFAATVGLVGTLQGEVDLKIIKISLLVRLTATAGIAFETDYNAILNVSASVEVKASVKILFVKISVSFSADVSQTFVLSQGGLGDASLNGPNNPSFKNFSDKGVESNTQPLLRSVRRGHYRQVTEALLATDGPVTIPLSVVLYPAATYSGGQAQSQAVALLMMTGPEYGADNTGGGKTAWETLMDAYASWLLYTYSGGSNSWEAVLEQLNEEPAGFGTALVETFLAEQVNFTLSGIDLTQQNEPVNMVFFPMMPNLEMALENAQKPAVVFDQQLVSADFLTQLSEYAAQFSISALMSDAESSNAAMLYKALEGQNIPLNSLLFVDYFLMVGQQLAQLMHDAAPENTTPDVDTAANVAGFVSRFLLNGLAAPSLQDSQQWAALYEITGQQFGVETTQPNTSATLAINSAYVPVSGQPDFSKLTIQITPDSPAVIPVAGPPAAPDTLPGQVAVLPALSPTQLWVGVRNRISWQADGQALQFVVPMPNRIQQLLNDQPLMLTVQTDYPHNGQSGQPVNAAPGLLIGIKLFQIKQNELFNINEEGQTSDSYLPFVYTIGGTDEETRDRIEDLLNSGDLAGATLTLLYNASDSGYLSDVQNPKDTFLVKTNLSTSSEPSSIYASLRFKSFLRSMDDNLGPVSAQQRDTAGFLRIVWENSVVNSGGFFLYYNDVNNKDLPASIFNGGQADLQILVNFPTNTLYQSWHNVFAAPAEGISNALYIGPSTAAGIPLQEYQSTYPTGCTAFEALPAARLFAEEAEDAATPPYSEDSIAQLYHLLQYQIAPNAGQGLPASGWSPSVSPMQQQSNSQSAISPDDAPLADEAEANAYRQVVPLYNFIAAAAPSSSNPLPNIYAAVGVQSTLQLRMADVYGNVLGAAAQNLPFQIQYTDTIWSLAQWPGVSVNYLIGLNNQAPALNLQIQFDPSQVLRNFNNHTYVVESLRLGQAAGNDEDLKQQAQIALYKLYFILHQLNDSHTHQQVSTTLFVGNDAMGKVIAGDDQLKQPLISFANQIVGELNKVMGNSQNDVQALSLNIPIPITPSDIAQTQGSILPVSVWMNAYRDDFLPDNANLMPNLSNNAFVVKPQAVPNADSSSSDLTVFAQNFEQVFAGFDGATGLVKLASRTGNSDFSASDTASYLWAVKWSETQGINLKFQPGQFVYYTLSPLSNQLLPNQQAEITTYDDQLNADTQNKTFTNIDVDAFAIDFLSAVDEMLDPELAAAMAKADSVTYASIMQAKANLAATLKKGLIPVFDGQSGQEDSAMDCFEQALLSKLSTAYTVSAVVQTPVQVSNSGDTQDKQPRIFGSISPNEQNTAKDYTLTNAKLELDPTDATTGPDYLNFLATAKHPQTQADLQLDLSYKPVFIEHLLQEDQADFGYTPSSWLRYVLVDDQQPSAFELGVADIPVPLRQYPQSPVLESQVAKGAGADLLKASSNPVEDALKWAYQAAVVPAALNAQDELWFDVVYNLPVSNLNGRSMLKSNPSALESLFQRFAAFNAAYSSLRSLLIENATDAVNGPVPADLGKIMGILTPLMQEVALAYAAYMNNAELKASAGDPPTVIRKHFVLSFKQIAQNVLTLYGDSSEVSEFPKNINEQASKDATPVLVPSAEAPADGNWYKLQYPYAPDNSEPGRLTMLWSDINAVARQTGLTEYWIVRNADLGAGTLKVNSDLIYTTARLAFANPVLPLVHIYNTEAQTFNALSETLAAILEPFISAGTAFQGDRLLKVESNYAYNLLNLSGAGATQQQLWVPVSINLVDDLLLSAGGNGGVSVSQFACDLAKKLDAWHQVNKPQKNAPGLQAQLSFNITLFAVIDDSNLPLIKAENIYAYAPTGNSGWWPVVCAK